MFVHVDATVRLVTLRRVQIALFNPSTLDSCVVETGRYLAAAVVPIAGIETAGSYEAGVVIQDSTITSTSGTDAWAIVPSDFRSSNELFRFTIRRCAISGPWNSLIEYGAGPEPTEVLVESSTLSGSLGDGIFANNLYLKVNDSTISGNAGVAIEACWGDVEISNTTIANNGAGISDSGCGTVTEISAINTLFSNTGACSWTPSGNAYNLSDESTCASFAPGDIGNVDVNLAPLGNYGGPTLTHALCTGVGVPHASCIGPSPALDAGNPATPGSGGGACGIGDQRGAVRPAGGRCDIGAYEYACGNGETEFDEACDDGGQASGDCCTATCAMPSCMTAPKSSLSLTDKTDDSKDKLSWKWSKGTAGIASFGDPASTTDSHLCLWDDNTLKMDALVDAAGTCGEGDNCWSTKGTPITSYKYKNKIGNASGITAIQLKEGTEKASVSAKGKGANLPLPGPTSPTRYFNQASEVTVQLVGSDAPQCFEATYSSASKNSGEIFKAKLD